jgi:hypothetical protein
MAESPLTDSPIPDVERVTLRIRSSLLARILAHKPKMARPGAELSDNAALIVALTWWLETVEAADTPPCPACGWGKRSS